MKALFTSELRRFRNAALITAVLHLLMQLFASRVTDLLQLRWEQHVVALLLYMLAGIAFAVYQFGTYRQPSRWLWLLHRPLPRLAIFGALALASATLILFAIGLPALLAVIGTDLLTARTVDLRHYLLALHVVVFVLNAWLAGAYVMLNGRRSAAVVLLLPLLLLSHLASGLAMLLPALFSTLLLTCVAYSAFKPDRTSPPSHGPAVLAAAVPLVLGFYFTMVWAGSLGFQYGQMLLGVHPLNRPLPPAGGFTELTRSEGRDAILRGLSVSADPRAAHWKRQVPLLEVGQVEPATRRYPVRHQISNLDSLQWHDGERNVVWTFSHDAMRFEGADIYTGQPRGWYGAGGRDDTARFDAVPLLAGDMMMTPQQLLQRGAADGAPVRLLRVPEPEVLAAPPRAVGPLHYVLTDRRLLAYRLPDPSLERPQQLEPQFSVPLPGTFADLDRIDIAPLLDGTLLSVNHGRAMIDGTPGSHQTLLFVTPQGSVQTVGRRALAHDFPLLFEHKDWWISPLTHAALALPEILLDKGAIGDDGRSALASTILLPRPLPVVGAALLAALLSAATAAWWMRGGGASVRRRIAWCAACLALGPPGLATLMLLQPRAAPVHEDRYDAAAAPA